jgi:hypothetical protein
MKKVLKGLYLAVWTAMAVSALALAAKGVHAPILITVAGIATVNAFLFQLAEEG